MTIVLGCLMCALGGVAVGSYLVALKFSRWEWDNSWLIVAFVNFVLVSFVGLCVMVPSFCRIYADTPLKDIFMVFLFGLIAGTGVYLWRYMTTLLGLALTYAFANSSCMAFSIMVPMFGKHMDRVSKLDGIALLIAAVLLAIGFSLAGKAGARRERELGVNVQREIHGKKRVNMALAAFIVVASALMESMYVFSVEFQQSMKHIAMDKYHVPLHAWSFLNTFPYMVGIFVPTLIVTLIKMVRSGTLKDYWTGPRVHREYFLAILAGLICGLGGSLLFPAGFALIGPLGASAGTALFGGMSTVSSSLCGIWTGEWKGVSQAAMRLLYVSISVIALATILVGLGNYLRG